MKKEQYITALVNSSDCSCRRKNVQNRAPFSFSHPLPKHYHSLPPTGTISAPLNLWLLLRFIHNASGNYIWSKKDENKVIRGQSWRRASQTVMFHYYIKQTRKMKCFHKQSVCHKFANSYAHIRKSFASRTASILCYKVCNITGQQVSRY